MSGLLPILAAVLAFITIGGLGWVFVGGEDSSSQALKRAQTLAEGKKNPAVARKAAVANTPEARRKQILVQLQEADRRERKARTPESELNTAEAAPFLPAAVRSSNTFSSVL